MSNLAHHCAIGLLRSVDQDEPLEMLWALDRDALRDRSAPAARVSALQRQAIEHHEAGHAFAAFHSGAQNIVAKVRVDGSGVTTCNKIENHVDAIVFHIAGPIAEARYMPSHIHRYTDGKSYDFMAARAAVTAFNKACGWQALSCQRAAQVACAFVIEHWARITDLALALESAGELSDSEIRLFSACRQ